MSESEAQRLAQDEGLSLQIANNSSGYKGVFRSNGAFTSKFKQGGKEQHLGTFSGAVTAFSQGTSFCSCQVFALAFGFFPPPLPPSSVFLPSPLPPLPDGAEACALCLRFHSCVL